MPERWVWKFQLGEGDAWVRAGKAALDREPEHGEG